MLARYFLDSYGRIDPRFRVQPCRHGSHDEPPRRAMDVDVGIKRAVVMAEGFHVLRASVDDGDGEGVVRTLREVREAAEICW